MKPRILAIDDEPRPWLENYKAWIPNEIAEQDSAATTMQAIELLRKYHYDVVLLDLSMDINDSFNRDNRVIQEYLATRPEGTRYIVISGTAEKAEVRDSTLHLSASDLIFKAEIEPAMLQEKVIDAIEEASKYTKQLVADTKRKLTDNGQLDSKILEILNPKEGNITLYPLLDTLFRIIAPSESHRDRPHFVPYNNCVLGIVWSRQIGKAISIVLANHSIPQEESIRELSDWLGYRHENQPFYSREAHRVRAELFEEPSISDAHFKLPNISPSGVEN